MADTTFVPTTTIASTWLNDVNYSTYRLIIPVSQYGAVGDGITDDTSALQACFDACSEGSTVMFVSGKSYKISSSLTIDKSLSIIGTNASIHTGSSNISVFTITASDVSVTGLTIEGGGNGSYNTSGKLIYVHGVDGGVGVAPTRISNVKIVDCVFLSASRSAILAQFVDQLRIINNTINDCAYAGIELLSCNYFTVSNNSITDITPGTGSNTYGIYASQTNSADTTRHPSCSYGTVVGNTLENISWEGLDCHGGSYIDFSHNKLINCGDTNAAIAIIHGDDETSTPITPATNVTIHGNSIYGAQQYGIATSSGSSTIIHKNISIVGNTIDNCGDVGSVNNLGGIRIGAAINVTITGNTLNYCAPYGIVINSEYCGSISVTGNTFRRMVSNMVTTPSAIFIDRTVTGTGPIYIGSNTLLRAGSGETYEAVNGVYLMSTDGGNVRIGENHFDTATTKYTLTATQSAGKSIPVLNAGEDSIAVTTSVASASKTIALANSHSANTLYNPSAVIWRATGNELTIVQCGRIDTSSFSVTVRTTDGLNFPANGNIEFYWNTRGY